MQSIYIGYVLYYVIQCSDYINIYKKNIIIKNIFKHKLDIISHSLSI